MNRIYDAVIYMQLAIYEWKAGMTSSFPLLFNGAPWTLFMGIEYRNLSKLPSDLTNHLSFRSLSGATAMEQSHLNCQQCMFWSHSYICLCNTVVVYSVVYWPFCILLWVGWNHVRYGIVVCCLALVVDIDSNVVHLIQAGGRVCCII